MENNTIATQMSLGEKIGQKILGKTDLQDLIEAEKSGLIRLTKEKLPLEQTFVPGDKSVLNLFRGSLLHLPGGATEEDALTFYKTVINKTLPDKAEKHHVSPPKSYGTMELTPDIKDQVIRMRKLVQDKISVEMRLSLLNEFHEGMGSKLSEKAFCNIIWLMMSGELSEKVYDWTRAGWNTNQLYLHLNQEYGRKRSNDAIKEEVERRLDGHSNGSIAEVVREVIDLLAADSPASDALEHTLRELRRYIKNSCGEIASELVESRFSRMSKQDVYSFAKILREDLNQSLQKMADERKTRSKIHALLLEQEKQESLLPAKDLVVSQEAESPPAKKSEVCYSCNKSGHYSRECPTKSSPSAGFQFQQNNSSYASQTCFIHQGHQHLNSACRTQLQRSCPLPGHQSHSQASCQSDLKEHLQITAPYQQPQWSKNPQFPQHHGWNPRTTTPPQLFQQPYGWTPNPTPAAPVQHTVQIPLPQLQQHPQGAAVHQVNNVQPKSGSSTEVTKTLATLFRALASEIE